MQFHAMSLVTIRRAERALQRCVLFTESASDAARSFTPSTVDEEGYEVFDPEAAVEAIRDEREIFEDAMDQIRTLKGGVKHEIKMLAIMDARGKSAVESFEGKSALDLEAQRRLEFLGETKAINRLAAAKPEIAEA